MKVPQHIKDKRIASWRKCIQTSTIQAIQLNTAFTAPKEGVYSWYPSVWQRETTLEEIKAQLKYLSLSNIAKTLVLSRVIQFPFGEMSGSTPIYYVLSISKVDTELLEMLSPCRKEIENFERLENTVVNKNILFGA